MLNTAFWPEHIGEVELTVAVGNGFTVTVELPLNVAEQFVVGLFTETKVNVWLAVAPFTVTVAVPVELKVTLVFAPPLSV